MPSQDDLTHLVEYSRVQPSQLSWVRSSSNTIQHLFQSSSAILTSAWSSRENHHSTFYCYRTRTDWWVHSHLYHSSEVLRGTSI